MACITQGQRPTSEVLTYKKHLNSKGKPLTSKNILQ